MAFVVVKNQDVEIFSKNVNEYLNDGFELHGNMITNMHPSGYILYIQALYKKDDTGRKDISKTSDSNDTKMELLAEYKDNPYFMGIDEKTNLPIIDFSHMFRCPNNEKVTNINWDNVKMID